jgi:hypothetical protein
MRENRPWSSLSLAIRRGKPELTDLAHFISVLDGFRVGRSVKLRDLDQYTKKLHLTDMGRAWKSLRRDLDAIANLPSYSPHMLSYVNILVLLRFLMGISFTSLIALSLLVFIGKLELEQPPFTFINIFVGLLAFANIVLVIRFFVREKLRGFYESSVSRYRGKIAHLKEVNQVLINQLNEKIRKANENPKKYKLTLYNIDYEGIKVLKKPGWWREHYVAIPIIGKTD